MQFAAVAALKHIKILLLSSIIHPLLRVFVRKTEKHP
jgi:hypothetical protein